MFMILFQFSYYALLSWFMLPIEPPVSQNPLTTHGITFQYYWRGDSLEIQLSAPTQGWIAAGFHSDNTLVGTDLYMFCIRQGNVMYQDQYIRNLNDHPADALIGGRSDVKIMGGLEDEWGTTVKFRIPLQSGDTYDFTHQVDQQFWLLLAYAEEDDFQHHSIIRKWVPYQLTRPSPWTQEPD